MGVRKCSLTSLQAVFDMALQQSKLVLPGLGIPLPGEGALVRLQVRQEILQGLQVLQAWSGYPEKERPWTETRSECCRAEEGSDLT